MGKFAPIVVTVYDRPIHFIKCIEALQMNAEAKESDLFIVSDAASCDYHVGNIEMEADCILKLERLERSIIFGKWRAGKNLKVRKHHRSCFWKRFKNWP